jgi:tRNA(Arg) A34 adenosine deaminase TadA
MESDMHDVSSTGNTLHSPRRRAILTAAAAGALVAATQPRALASAIAGTIAQPDQPGVSAFIARAFEMRARALTLGDQAYGAVVVRAGKIIGQSWSRVILDVDPTGHAEMAAIRDAARRLASRDLGGAVLYSSSRPCPMCEAAAYWAGIEDMIHGRAATRAGRPNLCR